VEQLPQAWIAMGESLLIGLLVGIERESDHAERHAGLRDFIGIGLAGGLCGLLAQPLITVAALLSITSLLFLFRAQTPGRTGITTEIVGVVTFLLCVLTATPGLPWGTPLAIALTVILAICLEAREPLQKFFRETLTEREYFDTLRFLAVVFVILPVLPDGGYGPYEFFNPRRVWIFVILVCSISYLGYFLQKFLGDSQGLRLTAILGGIGSTTAATAAFAEQAAEEPHRARELALATVLANTVQFPRVLALLWMMGGALGMACWPELAAMTAAGLVLTVLLARTAPPGAPPPSGLVIRNTFHIRPAIKFGLLFAFVRLIARGGAEQFGQTGLYVSSAIGGSVDADAIAVTLSGMMRDGKAVQSVAVASLLIALAANAVLKSVVAYRKGGAGFGRKVAIAFGAMFAAGFAVWLIR
jgi:uncharacterized membrane protein (DUF4010 family)